MSKTIHKHLVGSPVVSILNPAHVMLVREVIQKRDGEDYLCSYVTDDGKICNTVFNGSDLRSMYASM